MVRAAFEAAAEMIDGVKMALNVQAYCCDLLISLKTKPSAKQPGTSVTLILTCQEPPTFHITLIAIQPPLTRQEKLAFYVVSEDQKKIRYLQERKIIHSAAAVQKLQDFTEPKAGACR